VEEYMRVKDPLWVAFCVDNNIRENIDLDNLRKMNVVVVE
jgi:hypothetical protein